MLSRIMQQLHMGHLNRVPLEASMWLIGACVGIADQCRKIKCCRLKDCITTTDRFAKLCLDQNVLELCVRNLGEIRNDREDNSARSFRKAAYRQFILARHGHLGKGNRRVCLSFLCGFTNKKAISLTYRCLHGLSRTLIVIYCLSDLLYKYNFVNKAMALWPKVSLGYQLDLGLLRNWITLV